MKILICDYTGGAQQWLDDFTIKKNYEVVGSISSTSDKNLLLEKNWDYLLIFEQNARQFFDSMTKFMNIAAERVIYALDIQSWLEHPAAIFAIVNPTGGAAFYRHLSFGMGRQMNYYMSCTTADGLHYIATSGDSTIMGTMYVHRRTWSQGDMQLFHGMAEYFYHVDDSSGMFLDLGANIGTTGIYFVKKLAPKLKLLAFEPDAENFKMLRANLILNDLYEKTTAENFGLGIAESEQIMYRFAHNPGHNGMLSNDGKKDTPTATVKIISLDKYFAEKNLRAEDVKYIWIDTEGFEPQVLLGAQNILRQNPAPIFMEFNPDGWQKSGFYEKIMALLAELYESYIFIQERTEDGGLIVQPLEKLWEYQHTRAFGDIFLIKK